MRGAIGFRLAGVKEKSADPLAKAAYTFGMTPCRMDRNASRRPSRPCAYDRARAGADDTIRPEKNPSGDGLLPNHIDWTLGKRMAQQKTNPKLEQALTRGDLAIRQANSARATALLRALGKMIVDASATIGVEASIDIPDGDRIYDPVNGVWPQKLLVSLDGAVEEADPDELRTVQLLADTPATAFRVEWQRADGKIGREEGRPLATVAFITDVEIPWSDDEE
jgi:hypothetical protein